MPNWCENRLEVSGDANELKKFLEIGIKEEPMRYSKTGETELIWRMSRYFSTPEPLTRTISPARDCEWVNEWEVNHTKKQIEEQPSRIAQLEKELETATGDEKMFVLSQLEEAKKPIEIPELIKCSNGTEKDRKALIKEFGTDNWYDWNVKNWGTKWDCDSSECGYDVHEDIHFVVNFNSAWSPPIGWLDNVIKLFPDLNFKLVFMETGNWFAGCVYNNEGGLEIVEGEPEYVQDGVVYNYDGDKSEYVGEDGTIIPEDDFDNTFPENPFECFDAPWE